MNDEKRKEQIEYRVMRCFGVRLISCWLFIIAFSAYGFNVQGASVSNHFYSSNDISVMVLMRHDFNTGPDGETCQLLLYRETPVGFQSLRKWLSPSQYTNSVMHLLAKDVMLFDEALSVHGGHFVSVHFQTKNLLEWHAPNSNAVEELGNISNNSMVARRFRSERALWMTLTGCGIAAVSNVVRQLDTGDYLVKTYSGTETVLRSDSSSGSLIYWFDDGKFHERSSFSPEMSSTSKSERVIVLRSERKASTKQDAWNHYLEAKLFQFPDEMPPIDILHKEIYHLATNGLWNWNIYSNKVFLAVDKIGGLQPGVRALKRNESEAPVSSNRRNFIRAIMVLSLLCVVGLLISKSRSENFKCQTKTK